MSFRSLNRFADGHWLLLRTCFFALGLVSSTPQGAEILEDYGWEATSSPLGLPTRLCIPADIEKFLSVRFFRVLLGFELMCCSPRYRRGR